MLSASLAGIYSVAGSSAFSGALFELQATSKTTASRQAKNLFIFFILSPLYLYIYILYILYILPILNFAVIIFGGQSLIVHAHHKIDRCLHLRHSHGNVCDPYRY